MSELSATKETDNIMPFWCENMWWIFQDFLLGLFTSWKQPVWH